MVITNLPCLGLNVATAFLLLVADSLSRQLFHNGLSILEGNNNSRACSTQVKRKSG